MSNSTNTIRLHRVLKAPAERVYRAFLDGPARCKWLPPYGFTATLHESDERVGGRYRMSFTNFTTGASHAFGGTYVELTPHERIRYTDRFDDPNLPGEMQVTVTLKPVSCGTELHVVQEGIPAVIPPEMCYLGWQESLMQLATLVEPEIPRRVTAVALGLIGSGGWNGGSDPSEQSTFHRRIRVPCALDRRPSRATMVDPITRRDETPMRIR